MYALTMKNVVAIIGSATASSANHKLMEYLRSEARDIFQVMLYERLKTLPHFDPDLSLEQTPSEIVELRNLIQDADGVIISTPEYLFSIPSGLKNAIEWCVTTTVFSGKPLGIITASTSGIKGHEELQLIMRTLMATFTPETTLLIQGIKGKIDACGTIIDIQTRESLQRFIIALFSLIDARIH
ncbi:NADPH-dependent FMN reductase [Candidatus Nitrosocosmicus franklandus]|uniref:NADPH azoreductase n=1 Tax=Candidatus Nitrosocosmicus franklandianus TaxID=1798806 RepID=A0A484IAQ3_9ARCH|nr:NADPH-dependent FMN reductase [Candidatus Nitrosocosmicus franklandus]VFJ13297.1 NADPH azoreductase [Candidatus Nitrosocosmicus franklandus]